MANSEGEPSRGGRPDGSDACLPLGGVGTRFVDPFNQVGQESDDCEIVPKMSN